MDKAKIMFVNQEISPYSKDSHLSNLGRYLPQAIQEKGKDVRTFMPRFGNINERRNQLHEVIRLSGTNIVIDDIDHPLIIKVASIQAARMQVYFIDNEDFFSKKMVLHDKSGKMCSDNDERAIFFARGVIETAKKLEWSPNLIHCNGWFTSMLPLYVKKVYTHNHLFANSKIVISLGDDQYKGKLSKDLYRKLTMDKICPKTTPKYEETDYVNFMKATIDLIDGIIVTHQDAHPDLIAYAKQKKKPILSYQGEENYAEVYNDFYEEILSK